MEIQKRKENDVTVIGVKGRLDAVSSPELEKELTGLMEEGETLFVLDFDGLDYIRPGLPQLRRQLPSRPDKGCRAFY